MLSPGWWSQSWAKPWLSPCLPCYNCLLCRKITDGQWGVAEENPGVNGGCLQQWPWNEPVIQASAWRCGLSFSEGYSFHFSGYLWLNNVITHFFKNASDLCGFTIHLTLESCTKFRWHRLVDWDDSVALIVPLGWSPADIIPFSGTPCLSPGLQPCGQNTLAIFSCFCLLGHNYLASEVAIKP